MDLLNLKDIILNGNITWSEMARRGINEALIGSPVVKNLVFIRGEIQIINQNTRKTGFHPYIAKSGKDQDLTQTKVFYVIWLQMTTYLAAGAY